MSQAGIEVSWEDLCEVRFGIFSDTWDLADREFLLVLGCTRVSPACGVL